MTIHGIKITLHYSWFLALGVITYSLSTSYFTLMLPYTAFNGLWVVSFIATLMMFLSIVVHELAHSYVAIKNGLPVKEIVLHFFGGVAVVETCVIDPKVDLQVAIAGPIVSILIGLFFLFAGGRDPIAFYLAISNLFIGIFNLMPSYPLDGGRILRGLIWMWTKNYIEATKIAAFIGSKLAIFLMAGGVLFTLYGRNGIAYIGLGYFLSVSAETAYKEMKKA